VKRKKPLQKQLFKIWYEIFPENPAKSGVFLYPYIKLVVLIFVLITVVKTANTTHEKESKSFRQIQAKEE
jgi:hypothetical protein